MIKKDEWIFIMRHESKGEKISRVRAKTFQSALKQIRNSISFAAITSSSSELIFSRNILITSLSSSLITLGFCVIMLRCFFSLLMKTKLH